VKILQITTSLDVGGAEKHLLELCRGLKSNGHTVDLIYLKGSGKLAVDFEKIGIQSLKIPYESLLNLPSCLVGLYSQIKKTAILLSIPIF